MPRLTILFASILFVVGCETGTDTNQTRVSAEKSVSDAVTEMDSVESLTTCNNTPSNGKVCLKAIQTDDADDNHIQLGECIEITEKNKNKPAEGYKIGTKKCSGLNTRILNGKTTSRKTPNSYALEIHLKDEKNDSHKKNGKVIKTHVKHTGLLSIVERQAKADGAADEDGMPTKVIINVDTHGDGVSGSSDPGHGVFD